MFQPSKQTISELDRLSSSYRITHRQGRIQVEIIDILTGKAYAEAESENKNESQVLDMAVEQAKKNGRPLTTSELAEQNSRTLAAENERLKAELAALKAAPKPTPAKRNWPKPKEAEPNDGEE